MSHKIKEKEYNKKAPHKVGADWQTVTSIKLTIVRNLITVESAGKRPLPPCIQVDKCSIGIFVFFSAAIIDQQISR